MQVSVRGEDAGVVGEFPATGKIEGISAHVGDFAAGGFNFCFYSLARFQVDVSNNNFCSFSHHSENH